MEYIQINDPTAIGLFLLACVISGMIGNCIGEVRSERRMKRELFEFEDIKTNERELEQLEFAVKQKRDHIKKLKNG